MGRTSEERLGGAAVWSLAVEATMAGRGYSLPRSSLRSSKKLMKMTMREPMTPMKKSQIMTDITAWARAITGTIVNEPGAGRR